MATPPAAAPDAARKADVVGLTSKMRPDGIIRHPITAERRREKKRS
jgi:hypothetical protein